MVSQQAMVILEQEGTICYLLLLTMVASYGSGPPHEAEDISAADYGC